MLLLWKRARADPVAGAFIRAPPPQASDFAPGEHVDMVAEVVVQNKGQHMCARVCVCVMARAVDASPARQAAGDCHLLRAGDAGAQVPEAAVQVHGCGPVRVPLPQ